MAMPPLEYVLPCREVLLHIFLFMCTSKLMLIAELSGPHVRNTPCLLLVLSLIKDSVLFHLLYFLSFYTFFVFSFFPPCHILPSSSYQLWVNSSVLPYCSHGRIGGPAASRYKIGVITFPKQLTVLLHF